jgi:hypothetical protein
MWFTHKNNIVKGLVGGDNNIFVMKIIPEKRVVRTEFDIYVFMSVVTLTRLCYAKTLISNALCRGRFVC